MIHYVITGLLFLIGCFILFTSGATGYWEDMNTSSWIGLGLVNLSLVYVLIVKVIGAIKNKKTK